VVERSPAMVMEGEAQWHGVEQRVIVDLRAGMVSTGEGGSWCICWTCWLKRQRRNATGALPAGFDSGYKPTHGDKLAYHPAQTMRRRHWPTLRLMGGPHMADFPGLHLYPEIDF
jgi:hypothetical protein